MIGSAELDQCINIRIRLNPVHALKCSLHSFLQFILMYIRSKFIAEWFEFHDCRTHDV